MRLDFDIRDIMEDNLIFFYGAFVKDLAGNVFERKVNALGLGFFLNVWEKPHLKLKGKDVHAGHALFAAFEDDFFYKQTGNGQIDRTYSDNAPGFLAVEAPEVIHRLGLVGFE